VPSIRALETSRDVGVVAEAVAVFQDDVGPWGLRRVLSGARGPGASAQLGEQAVEVLALDDRGELRALGGIEFCEGGASRSRSSAATERFTARKRLRTFAAVRNPTPGKLVNEVCTSTRWSTM
jgi:hypothetical protein